MQTSLQKARQRQNDVAVMLHCTKNGSFTLQIFSVNVTKSAGSTIGAVLWENLNDRKNPDSLNIFKHKI